MSGMRLPLTLSTAGHAIAFVLLVLLVADPSPQEPTVKGGIEVTLGQSLSQPQAVLAPEAASPPADPSAIAALPPQEIAETEPVVTEAEPPPTPVSGMLLPPGQTERQQHSRHRGGGRLGFCDHGLGFGNLLWRQRRDRGGISRWARRFRSEDGLRLG